MKFAKVAAVAAIALVLAACGQSDTVVPMDKLLMQYKEIKAGGYKGVRFQFSNVTLTNVRCRTEKIAHYCTVDGSGHVTYTTTGLTRSEVSEDFTDKNLEMKFFNREAFPK